MEAVIIILFVVFVISISILQHRSHERKIIEYIHSMGGEIITVKRNIFTTGPFSVIRKGRSIYRIEYRKGNEIKEGWVKFGDLFGPEWKL